MNSDLFKCTGFALLFVLCGSCAMLDRPLRKHESYTRGLQCEMTVAEVASYAKGSSWEVQDVNSKGVMATWKKNTSVDMFFGEVGLSAYQVSWIYPLTNFGSLPKVDICEKKKYLRLSIVGDFEMPRTKLFLDRRPIGDLLGLEVLEVDVPLGPHTLTASSSCNTVDIPLDYTGYDVGHGRVELSRYLQECER